VNVGFEKAVTDGNLVTGAAWTAHVEWIRQFLTVLGTRIVQQEKEAAMA
jgi:protease I